MEGLLSKHWLAILKHMFFICAVISTLWINFFEVAIGGRQVSSQFTDHLISHARQTHTLEKVFPTPYGEFCW